MTKIQTKKITIEDLARIMSKVESKIIDRISSSESHLESRIDDIEDRLYRLEHKVENGFEEIVGKDSAAQRRFTELEQRVDIIEKES